MSKHDALALRVQEAGLVPTDWTQATILACRTTMYEHLTDKEFVVLVSACQAYGLDPFRREVEIIKGNVFVGRNGWISAMQKNPRYLTHKPGLIYEHEAEAFKVVGGEPHPVQLAPNKRGQLVGAYCQIITVDGGSNTFVREPSDYKHLWNRDGWKKDMANMLTIRTICHAARSTFSMSNLYMFDEKNEVLSGQVFSAGERQSEMATARLHEIAAGLAVDEGGSQGEDSAPVIVSDRVPDADDSPPATTGPVTERAIAKEKFETLVAGADADYEKAYNLLCELMQVPDKNKRKLTTENFERAIKDWDSFLDLLMPQSELLL